ncbi:hypothetical protein LIP_2259 [Limnochorda pilosa]|uniref:Uncharacterized protein n=1 Tax=Limnochorda pilosa TaxID=1555112 RepID=A0A0K2SLX1_LIMPI|nr:hypothetical protein LIP_2259 [Limnochorda pilosa]
MATAATLLTISERPMVIRATKSTKSMGGTSSPPRKVAAAQRATPVWVWSIRAPGDAPWVLAAFLDRIACTSL